MSQDELDQRKIDPLIGNQIIIYGPVFGLIDYRFSSYSNLRRHDRDIHEPERRAAARRSERDWVKMEQARESEQLRKGNSQLKAKVQSFNAQGCYN